MLTNSQLTNTVSYKQHTICRVCGSERLTPYLDLGMLPLSNNLASSATDPIHDQRYPLKVLLCEKCGLSQLSIVIPPETLFGHYVYRSSISKGYMDHCHEMAIELRDRHGLAANSFHIDIAGNDGALLKQFADVIGCKSLNIDPAANLLQANETIGIRQYTTFWGMGAANHLINTGWPKADLITATNVFAHVADVKEFLQAVKLVLKPTGVLVLEFPYLVNFIENGEFDTIYHEHLSYFSVYPITLLCEKIGLTVMSVSKQNIHGGSIRVIIGYGKQDQSVGEFIRNELNNYLKINRYYEFAEDVHIQIHKFKEGIINLKNVAGFAASAKGSTLLNCAGITSSMMRYVVDQTPEKVGKYSPGTKIQIVGTEVLKQDPPDYLVILSWNFKNEIIEKCRAYGYKGKFIVGIPTFEIID